MNLFRRIPFNALAHDRIIQQANEPSASPAYSSHTYTLRTVAVWHLEKMGRRKIEIQPITVSLPILHTIHLHAFPANVYRPRTMSPCRTAYSLPRMLTNSNSLTRQLLFVSTTLGINCHYSPLFLFSRDIELIPKGFLYNIHLLLPIRPLDFIIIIIIILILFAD